MMEMVTILIVVMASQMYIYTLYQNFSNCTL